MNAHKQDALESLRNFRQTLLSDVRYHRDYAHQNGFEFTDEQEAKLEQRSDAINDVCAACRDIIHWLCA